MREKLNARREESQKEPTRINPLQMMNAVHIKEAVKSSSLLYVPIVIYGHNVMAMVDIGATHNFVPDWTVEFLSLGSGAITSRVKAVNSEAQFMNGSV